MNSPNGTVMSPRPRVNRITSMQPVPLLELAAEPEQQPNINPEPDPDPDLQSRPFCVAYVRNSISDRIHPIDRQAQ